VREGIKSAKKVAVGGVISARNGGMVSRELCMKIGYFTVIL
jgi:hypothetical protein